MIESMETDPETVDPWERRLHELAFLHDIAQLATLARDWDELMRTIVDRTTVAMGWKSALSTLPTETERD